MRSSCIVVCVVFALVTGASAAELPDGYMSEKDSQEILDKLLVVNLDPDISGLTEAEREVALILIDVGMVFERLHVDMRHHQALEAFEALKTLDAKMGSPRATRNLMDLFYSAKGPIVRDLEGERRTILPVDVYTSGRNVYPWGIAKEEVDNFLDAHPEARPSILHLRTIVRRGTPDNTARDLAALDKYPAVDALHPGVRQRVEAAAAADPAHAFYAVPYPVAYADELFRCFELLMEAGDTIADEDPEYAAYLRNRARDLLSNDYESGDASWVTGRFNNLNSQIGAYEVYDDALFGVKAFFSLNVLVRDKNKSATLRQAIRGIQALENSLPYEPDGYDGGDKKKVNEDIPVGVYNVVADFGQSRGGNTATILPNESAHARKYGRTILLRNNIMTNPEFFRQRQLRFRAAVVKAHANDLTAEASFNRTLWHEVGHYLGVDRTRDGRDLGEALEQSSSAYEEMKSDLVSLFVGPQLLDSGYYTEKKLRNLYADGVRRVLLTREPQRSQPYQTMELMQFNYYLENGLLEYNEKDGRLIIHYDRFHDVVARLLARILEIQYAGDLAEADEFMERYTVWEDGLHGALAKKMRAVETYRYRTVTYEAVDPIGR